MARLPPRLAAETESIVLGLLLGVLVGWGLLYLVGGVTVFTAPH
jgi:hypothetical protein